VLLLLLNPFNVAYQRRNPGFYLFLRLLAELSTLGLKRQAPKRHVGLRVVVFGKSLSTIDNVVDFLTRKLSAIILAKDCQLSGFESWSNLSRRAIALAVDSVTVGAMQDKVLFLRSTAGIFARMRSEPAG
jgi:hypothetical protein